MPLMCHNVSQTTSKLPPVSARLSWQYPLSALVFLFTILSAADGKHALLNIIESSFFRRQRIRIAEHIPRLLHQPLKIIERIGIQRLS